MSFVQQARHTRQSWIWPARLQNYQRIAACFRGQQEGMPLTSAPPGSLMVSWGERNTCSGCGHSGSTLPGATPQMKVRFRDWLTPKLPAFSTPKRTCTHSPHPGDQLAAEHPLLMNFCLSLATRQPWQISLLCGACLQLIDSSSDIAAGNMHVHQTNQGRLGQSWGGGPTW